MVHEDGDSKVQNIQYFLFEGGLSLAWGGLCVRGVLWLAKGGLWLAAPKNKRLNDVISRLFKNFPTRAKP